MVDFVCRCVIQRSGIYFADFGTEKLQSDGGGTDFESGIQLFCAGRLLNLKGNDVGQGADRLRTDVCGDCIGTAAGQDKEETVK